MFRTIKTLIKWTVIAIAAIAIIEELRKPAEDREWHGRVGGVVPYEFRPPSVNRLRDAWWNPEDPRLIGDTAFGVGWTVNLARVRELVGKNNAAFN
jgi:hypothetical protein